MDNFLPTGTAGISIDYWLRDYWIWGRLLLRLQPTFSFSGLFIAHPVEICFV
jgi:hypothetical protein